MRKPLLTRKLKSPLEIQGCKLWLDASKGGSVKSGNAAQFNSGFSESLSIADGSQTGLDPLLGDFAVAGWLYADTLTSKTMLAKGATTDVNPNSIGYYVNINASDQLSAFFGDGTAARISTAGSTTLSANTWYFATWNFDRDGNVTIRLNDQSEGAGTDISAQQGSLNSTDPFVIGSKSGNTLYFNGRLQNWIVLNRLLTAAEITWLYNGGLGQRFEDYGQTGTDGANLTVAGGIVSGWKLGEESGQRNDFFGTNHLTDNNTVTQNDGVALVDAVDGDYVRQWTDLSGNAYSFTQTGNVTKKPLFKSGIVNGKSVIRWDGTDDRLTNTTKANWQFLHDGTSYTIFIVFKMTDANPDALMGIMGNSNSTSVGFEVGYDDRSGSGLNDSIRYRLINNTPAAIVNVSGAGFNNTWSNPDVIKIFAVTYENGITGNDGKLYKNGALLAGADTTGAHSAVDSGGDTDIGTFGSGNSSWFKGDLAEIIIYNRVLTSTELRKLTKLLGRRYNIPITL